MNIIAGIVLVSSLLGIVGLFVLKYFELKHEHVLAQGLRVKFDSQASEMKVYLFSAASEAEKLPSIVLHMIRVLAHEIALFLARMGRSIERNAFRLADVVSHKRKFEHKETRSKFLQQVGEYKNTNEVE